MNAKKAKAIRRYVRSLGHVKAQFPLHHINLMGNKLVPHDHHTAGFGGIAIAKYPATSFQHIYRLAKRTARVVPIAVLNARAALNLAAGIGEGRQVPYHRSGGGLPAPVAS